tara:strand:- start:325 stop:621 length:297 start_codon:yes stop_codon:yes gene_type:complete
MAKTKIQPLDDRVLLEPLEAEETTAGGIVLPDTAQEKPQQAKVVAVGDGRLSEEGNRIPVSVKAGDTVVYSKFGGDEVSVDGKDCKIVRENDILAILD